MPELERPIAIVTDPPYGIGFRYGESYEDLRDGYHVWMGRTFEILRQCSERLLLTVGTQNLWLYPPANWVLCWAKPGSVRHSRMNGFCEWEPVLVYGKLTIYNDFKLLPTGSNYSRDLKSSLDHPCPKPLRLYRWLVSLCSEPGDLVIDPFAGSGTTLKAAKELGRRAIGIDIEEKYCEVAARRLRQEMLQFDSGMVIGKAEQEEFSFEEV